MVRTPKLSIHPVTPTRWPDVERLFGERGACGGCWCMAWRLPRKEFELGKGRSNRLALKTLVSSDKRPGVLAYIEHEPVGWCAVAPREDYVALETSRVLAPVDKVPVWSISCLFVARPFRNKGISVRLIRAAVELARSEGATIVEAYPVIPKSSSMPAVFAWTGIMSAFEKAGFREVMRRSESRPIMRRRLRQYASRYRRK